MKAFVISIILLVVLCTFIGVHSYIMINLSDSIAERCNKTLELVNSDSWDSVEQELDKISDIWDSRRMWASLTINTSKIEQIEISLNQSKAYAHLGQKSDFMGEFIMFSMLVDHIPHEEGFHIEEIL